MGCENGCNNEHRIQRLESDFRDWKQRNSEDHKEFYDRIEKSEKDMVESIGDRKHITQQLEEINGNVKTLMEKPAKRYDTVVTSVLTAAIGALVGFILSGVLPT